MKTIIAVFFFGVVTYAYTPKPPHVVSKCEEKTPKAGFQSSQFFTGTWFVTQAVYVTTSVCHKFDAKMTGSTISVTADGYYEIGNKRDFYNVPCTGTDVTKNGKFTLTCQPKRKSDTSTKNTINVQVDVTVLETDYNKYALVYRCATSGPRITDNYLVLQRKEDDQISNLDKILKSQGLVPDNMISRKKSKNVCIQMPTA
uniref:Salivary lipocalin n=1 Tax=Triatoma infestans TaxID=30076 RepID=A6YPL3_TRIIF|nr:salivary lipocalin [Triatoma infestans]